MKMEYVMPKYHDHFPDKTIKDCLDCLDKDLAMLYDGSWVPDLYDDSIEASQDMLVSIRAKLYGGAH